MREKKQFHSALSDLLSQDFSDVFRLEINPELTIWCCISCFQLSDTETLYWNTPQLIRINYAFTDSICFVIRYFSARHLLWLCIYFWLQSVWIVSKPVFQPEIASARHGLSLFSAVSSANCACWAGRLASHPASSQANLQDRSQAGYRPTCSQTGVAPARQTVAARTGSQGHPS